MHSFSLLRSPPSFTHINKWLWKTIYEIQQRPVIYGFHEEFDKGQRVVIGVLKASL